ncbi:hypothetical protein [Paraburkholderia youngii]|uniref:hypothetical protein n=1 Tax=Paraburkholderia youngii TaxID=2782701 RepID=UPI003D23EF46
MSDYATLTTTDAEAKVQARTREAIDRAIAAGASGAEAPPDDHWLYRYWAIGNDLQASLCAAASASVGEHGDPLLTRAVRTVVGERVRQITEEGRTPEADDQYRKGELAMASMGYLHAFVTREQSGKAAGAPAFWPWDAAWYKPRSGEDDLARAAALAIAQLQNYYRSAAQPKPMGEQPEVA